mmetsp:Transcript_31123/g.57507  ORF Transcript_31123/g.57507 Transcript_31123/m.57507 type:complete len:490 (-) Transcript_31123:85-1554(-)
MGSVSKCVLNVLVTVFLGAMTAVVAYLAFELRKVEEEVATLKIQMKETVNTTIVYLNTTVVEATESMQQEVQDVDAQVNAQGSLMAYQGAGTFAVLSVVVFFWHMTAHLREMHEPTIQRKILAILWMVPIYAVTSWVSLVVGGSAEWYLAVIKDVYEAYCIYMFLSFLISVLGKGKRDAVVDLLVDRVDHLRPPVDCCGLFFNESKYKSNPRARADAILYQCQFCTMQFVFLRPVTTLGMALSNQFYGTDWNIASPQFLFVLIQNISIFLAFSGLLKFYHATQKDLSWCNPFPKFLCIKGVVFMTFWQGMVITILSRTVFVVDDPMEWSRQAQNFLVCLEMLFFAIAHCFVFPTEEWKEGYRPRERNHEAKFGDGIALRDFAKDVRFIIKSRKKRRTKQEGNSPYHDLGPANAATEYIDETDAEFDENENGDNYIIVYDSYSKGGSDGDGTSTAIVLGSDGVARDAPLDLQLVEEHKKQCRPNHRAEII